MDYIAHIRSSDGAQQKVENHLLNVKSLCERYGDKLRIKHLAGLAGLLHDLGKYSKAFRNYILEAAKNPNDYSKRGTVDHSTAGGKWLFEQLHDMDNLDRDKFLVAEVVGNAIISHHSYLHDFLNSENKSDYLRRVEDKQIEDFENLKNLFFEKVMNKDDFIIYINKAVEEMKEYISKVSNEKMSTETKLMFLSKILFSMLIDADRTDARLFEEGEIEQPSIDTSILFKQYYNTLVSQLKNYSKDGHINQLRNYMSEQCDAFAEKDSGIYTLSIPTGGGKTLASLRYALKHAFSEKKERIIYVVPYTTIIEQNAMEVREKLGDYEHILEHHSNIIEDDNENDEDEVVEGIKKKLKLARDNWDSPIIFTTMVQFLNVFYAKGTRDIRRLHRLLNSVIIFDEVQKVPLHCTSLFNVATNYLKLYGNNSILLCTATQPTLGEIKKYQLSIDNEIIKNIDNVVNEFKRVEVVDKLLEITNNDELCEFIQEILPDKKSLLVILNTKRAVKDLYDKLKEVSLEVPIHHLSTSMCAAHRKNKLIQIKKHLQSDEQVICLSTQLIEAGVDISFSSVIRSLAGLDSIAQAAGRCNRHGETKIQQVYVIDNRDDKLDKLKEIHIGKEIAKDMFVDLRNNPNEYGDNILSSIAMERYFNLYYSKWTGNDIHYPIKGSAQINMVQLLTNNKVYLNSYESKMNQRFPLCLRSAYNTAAKNFQVIKDETTTVVVPYKDENKVNRDGKDLIADLSGNYSIDSLSQWLKEAQLYTISIYSNTKKELIENGGIKLYENDIYVLNEAAYNEEVGLDIELESLVLMSI